MYSKQFLPFWIDTVNMKNLKVDLTLAITCRHTLSLESYRHVNNFSKGCAIKVGKCKTSRYSYNVYMELLNIFIVEWKSEYLFNVTSWTLNRFL